MNESVNKILDEALKRAMRDKSLYDWKCCSTEQKIHTIQLFVGIIIIELEMGEYLSDLDLEAIKIVRAMTIEEWKSKMEHEAKIPVLSDAFIKSKIKERVAAGYRSIDDVGNGITFRVKS